MLFSFCFSPFIWLTSFHTMLFMLTQSGPLVTITFLYVSVNTIKITCFYMFSTCWHFPFLFSCSIHSCAGGLGGFSVYFLFTSFAALGFQHDFTRAYVDNSILSLRPLWHHKLACNTDLSHTNITTDFQWCGCLLYFSLVISKGLHILGELLHKENGLFTHQEFSAIAHRSDILHSYLHEINGFTRFCLFVCLIGSNYSQNIFNKSYCNKSWKFSKLNRWKSAWSVFVYLLSLSYCWSVIVTWIGLI